jgi:hypothetical protein
MTKQPSDTTTRRIRITSKPEPESADDRQLRDFMESWQPPAPEDEPEKAPAPKPEKR